MEKKLAAAIGRDVETYTPFSYPTDNFGLATIYADTGSRPTLLDQDFLCDTWNCLGIENPPTDSASQITVNGFAAVGTGGTIQLTEQEKNELAIKALLPELYQVLGVQGGFDQKRVTRTSLQMGPAHLRKLRRLQFASYVNGLGQDHPLRERYERGDLTVVVADAVVDNIKLDVTLDAEGSAALDAKLDPTAGLVKQLSGAKLGVKVSKGRAGTYSFEVTRPVIVRRLAKRQPAGGVLAEDDSTWSDWPSVEVPQTTPTKPATITAGNPR